jgi:hypothetical protein
MMARYNTRCLRSCSHSEPEAEYLPVKALTRSGPAQHYDKEPGLLHITPVSVCVTYRRLAAGRRPSARCCDVSLYYRFTRTVGSRLTDGLALAFATVSLYYRLTRTVGSRLTDGLVLLQRLSGLFHREPLCVQSVPSEPDAASLVFGYNGNLTATCCYLGAD